MNDPQSMAPQMAETIGKMPFVRGVLIIVMTFVVVFFGSVLYVVAMGNEQENERLQMMLTEQANQRQDCLETIRQLTDQ